MTEEEAVQRHQENQELRECLAQVEELLRMALLCIEEWEQQSLSREERVNLVDWQREELDMKMQAELLSLNRSSLYYQPVPPSTEEVALKYRIDELYTAHPYYGYRRITAQLQREDLEVNHKAVARHMREMSLAAVYPGLNLSKRAHQAAIYPYLLRNVTASTPPIMSGVSISPTSV